MKGSMASTPRKIKVLDNNTIDRIAAGEVIERPAAEVDLGGEPERVVVQELDDQRLGPRVVALAPQHLDGGQRGLELFDG